MTTNSNTASDRTFDRTEARELVLSLLDRLVWVVIPLGVVALTASALRMRHAGWSLLASCHASLLLAASMLLLLRRRLPRHVVLGGLSTVLVVNGLVNLLHLGLGSLALLILCCAAVFIGVSFGRRAGLLATAGLLLATIGGAAATAPGYLPLVVLPPGYLESPAAWWAQLTGFSLYTGIIVVCVGAVQEGLLRRARQLQRTNAELQREIAARERAEADLREREQRYRLLAENMRDVMFVQDMDLNVVYCSQSVQTLLGYSVEEALKLRPEDYLTPASLERLQHDFPHYMERVAAGELNNPPTLHYEYVRKDGSTFPGELRISLVRDGRNRPVASQGILTDISDRRRAEQEKLRLEEQLRQSEKLQAIGELAGGVAHDFNNQLTGILGSADLLRMELERDSGLVGYVDQILTSARRAADLTAKLLAFARRGRYRSIPVELNELLLEVAGILERSIERSITVETRLSADPLHTRGDPSQIQNALLNVALNARDAMARGGVLGFASQLLTVTQPLALEGTGAQLEPGRYVQVTISDQGVGMKPETVQRIFEPFFTTKEAGRGTGMGLAATYGTLKAHGGAIAVHSEPGQGTRFRLYFPATEETATRALLPEPPPGPELPVGRALVVEDEPVVLRNLEQMLDRLGYEVICSDRGDLGLERFRELHGELDLVVLDMNLPGRPGREVFQAMRELQPDQRIVICSGHSLEHELRDLLKQPNVAYLQKPFYLERLRQVLASLQGNGSAP